MNPHGLDMRLLRRRTGICRMGPVNSSLKSCSLHLLHGLPESCSLPPGSVSLLQVESLLNAQAIRAHFFDMSVASPLICIRTAPAAPDWSHSPHLRCIHRWGIRHISMYQGVTEYRLSSQINEELTGPFVAKV